MFTRWFGRNKTANAPEYDHIDPERIPKHVAIIMDGNGRWAQKRGLPRTFGHRAGAEALRAIVQTAAEIGIGALTAYAFSTENWKRPVEEVNMLMTLFSDYLDSEVEELHANQVRLRFIGNLEQLAPVLQRKMQEAQIYTASNSGLTLNLAVNYGGRAELVQAVQKLTQEILQTGKDPLSITDRDISRFLFTADLPDPDLLIRPSGDLRISNFLLWQIAYAELYFTQTNWPDFTPQHLIEAVMEYQRRERRFGGLKKKQ